MTLLEEAAAAQNHAAWVRYWQGDRRGEAPEPAYKDCVNCPMRKDSENVKDRRRICAECPMEGLPQGPSRRFLWAQRMAEYPDYLLATLVNKLSMQQHRDIAAIRRWHRIQEMGARLG